MTKKPKVKKARPSRPAPSVTASNDGSLLLSEPQFAQPTTTADPQKFTVAHGNDNPLYKKVQRHLLQAIPAPRGADVNFSLETAWGQAGSDRIKAIEKAGHIVFHSLGDTGSTRGPQSQSLVADKMLADFSDDMPGDRPAFLYHLGDIVYSFGEAQFYYDQFYEPYRSYPAPILAVPGNHDGMVYSGEGVPTLEAFLRNFVSDRPVKTKEAGGLIRTAMTQPGVYFTFEAPFVTLIGLYSNVLEDPGVISSEGDSSSPVDDQQLAFLRDALQKAKQKKNAVILVTHHPPYSGGTIHGGSPRMLQDIDEACQAAKFWPHVHLSGHAHNYQRFTRTINNQIDVAYVVCGNGGHGLSRLKSAKQGPMRTPIQISPELIFENNDDQDYGYLRAIADNKQLRVEFHDATPGQEAKSPLDAVTMDLQTHQLIAN